METGAEQQQLKKEMELKHKIHIFNLVNDIKFIWTSLCPFSFWNLPLRSEGDSLLSKVNLTLCPSPYYLLSLLETQFLFLSELFAPSTNILQSPNFKRSSLECLKSLCYFLIFPFPLNFLKVCLYLVSAIFFFGFTPNLLPFIFPVLSFFDHSKAFDLPVYFLLFKHSVKR